MHTLRVKAFHMTISELRALHTDLSRVPVHRGVVLLLGGIVDGLADMAAYVEREQARRDRLDEVLMNITGTATIEAATEVMAGFVEGFTPELSKLLGQQNPCPGDCEGCAGPGLSMGQAVDGVTLEHLPEGPAGGVTLGQALDGPELTKGSGTTQNEG